MKDRHQCTQHQRALQSHVMQLDTATRGSNVQKKLALVTGCVTWNSMIQQDPAGQAAPLPGKFSMT